MGKKENKLFYATLTSSYQTALDCKKSLILSGKDGISVKLLQIEN